MSLPLMSLNPGYIGRLSRLRSRARSWLTAVLGMVALPLEAMSAPAAGDYTKDQARAGAQIYGATCSVCHGSRLQGGAAPALTGTAFAQSLKTSYTTTSALFTLISTQMPVNNPGSLSKTQYTQVLAYILAENGYPAGSAPLDPAHLDDVALLPYPEQDAKKAPDADLEIANIGSSRRLLGGDFKICCRPANRGAAVAYGNVYVVTLDDRLIALDAASGAVLWNVAVADPKVGYSETMAPQVYQGKIIVGSAGGEWPIRGFVAAFDATTGKEVWRWQSTDPKTYAGDAWQRGGG